MRKSINMKKVTDFASTLLKHDWLVSNYCTNLVIVFGLNYLDFYIFLTIIILPVGALAKAHL